MIGICSIICFNLISCVQDYQFQENSTQHQNLSKTENQNVSDSIQKPTKFIYLTFDDGPNKGTKNLIQKIKKNKIPATMFIIGQHIYGSKKQRENFDVISNDTLFQIANHSWSHANNKFSSYYKQPNLVLDDFLRFNDSLKYNYNIIRTPARNIWRTHQINVTDIQSSSNSADTLYANDFILIGWDLEWHFDNENQIHENNVEMLNKIDSLFEKNNMRTKNHLVLLAHDQFFKNESNANELDTLIQNLKQNKDIEFRKIKDYPGIQRLYQ